VYQLPKSKKIVYIELSFLAHATEDADKVLKAVQNVLPIENVNEVTFTRRKLKGEYGNPIILFKTQIRNPELVEVILRNISSNLTELDKEFLLRKFELHLKKGNLYLRLDKQAAFMGRLKFCRADPIHLRVHFKTSNVEDLKDICRDIGMLP
jgi:RNA binding exosome subunit